MVLQQGSELIQGRAVNSFGKALGDGGGQGAALLWGLLGSGSGCDGGLNTYASSLQSHKQLGGIA